MPSNTLTKSRSNPNLPPPSPIGTRGQVRARAAAAKSGGVAGPSAGAARGRTSTGSTTISSSKRNGRNASAFSLKKALDPVGRGDANGDDSSSDLEIIAIPAPKRSPEKITGPTPSPTPTPKATPTPTPPPRRSVSFSQLSTGTATANRNPIPSGAIPRASSGSSTSPNRPPPKIKGDISEKPAPKKKASWQDEEAELDDIFVSKTWKSKPSAVAKRVPKPYQKPEASRIELSSASSSPSSSSFPPPGTEQGTAKAAKLDLPGWTKGRSKSRTGSSSVPPGPPPKEKSSKKRGKAVVHDSEEDSEREEDEGEEEVERRQDKGKARRRDEDESDSRRRRKKSKSLTPPSPPSAYRLQSALSNLHSNLGPSKLSSFSGNDDIIDADDQATDDDDDIQIMSNGAEASYEQLKKAEREKDERTCTLSITWVNRVDPVTGLEKKEGEFQFSQKIHENFSKVFATISSRKFIRQDDLILTFNDRTVYSFGNPNALKIYGGIEELFAYHKNVHEKAVEFRKMAGQRAAAQAEEEDASQPAVYGGEKGNAAAGPSGMRDSSREPSVVRAQSVATNEGGGEGGGGGGAAAGEKFKISIRGSATQIIAIAVKKSITLQKLLDMYCKTFDIPPENARNGKAWLEFDGEKLDLSSKLEDQDDIEEEETLEVRVKK